MFSKLLTVLLLIGFMVALSYIVISLSARVHSKNKSSDSTSDNDSDRNTGDDHSTCDNSSSGWEDCGSDGSGDGGGGGD